MKRILFVFAVLFSTAVFRVQAESLNPQDREIVAACLVLEAGGEGFDGMRAVLNVMLNRAKGDLGRLVSATVKRGAFSCMASIWNQEEPDYSPLIDRAMNQPEAYAGASQLLDTLEQGLLTDNTGGATHYHADYILPYWADSLHFLTAIGSHRFYTERAPGTASI